MCAFLHREEHDKEFNWLTCNRSHANGSLIIVSDLEHPAWDFSELLCNSSVNPSAFLTYAVAHTWRFGIKVIERKQHSSLERQRAARQGLRQGGHVRLAAFASMQPSSANDINHDEPDLTWICVVMVC